MTSPMSEKKEIPKFARGTEKLSRARGRTMKAQQGTTPKQRITAVIILEKNIRKNKHLHFPHFSGSIAGDQRQ